MTTRVIIKNGDRGAGHVVGLKLKDADGTELNELATSTLAPGEVIDVHLHSGRTLEISEAKTESGGGDEAASV